MKLAVISMIVASGFILSCGSETKTSGNNETSVSTEPTAGGTAAPTKDVWSLIVTGKEKLPACDAASEGRMAYVSGTKTATACQNGVWTDITINGHNSLVEVVDEKAGTNCKYGGKAISTGIDSDDDGKLGDQDKATKQYVCNGASGLKIKSIHQYSETLMNKNSPDISPYKDIHSTRIGNIQLTQFEDGSAFILVNGVVIAPDTNADLYTYNFSFSSFIPPNSPMYVTLTKSFDIGGVYADYKFVMDVELSAAPTFSCGISYGSSSPAKRDFILTKM